MNLMKYLVLLAAINGSLGLWAEEVIPCRSDLKSNTYQLERDKTTCRDLCPNTICGGRPAIMETRIYTEVDKYEIVCKCLAGRTESLKNSATNLTSCSGKCRIQYGGRYPNVTTIDVSYAFSMEQLKANCQEFCTYSRDAVACTLVSGSCR